MLLMCLCALAGLSERKKQGVLCSMQCLTDEHAPATKNELEFKGVLALSLGWSCFC